MAAFLLILKRTFNMKVSSLTFTIAWEIGSDRFLLDDFYKHADQQQFIYFTHQISFILIRNLGKRPSEKCSQFHQVHTGCHVCGCEQNRNYAGYGSLILLRSGVLGKMNIL
jgi:hypothetical protein